MFYETLLTWRGSYVQAMFLNDPEVIDLQAKAPDADWKPAAPSLHGWTNEVDAMYNIADQVQASRIRDPDQFKPHPRPIVPAEKERKKRKERKQEGGIEAAIKRGLKAAMQNTT